MIHHIDLGKTRFARLRTLAPLIRSEEIALGGHRPNKVYGRLDCRAGKRMKDENRIFFGDQAEAIEQGYRPCSVCMPTDYKTWQARE